VLPPEPAAEAFVLSQPARGRLRWRQTGFMLRHLFQEDTPGREGRVAC
jgi:hypothetical protein